MIATVLISALTCLLIILSVLLFPEVRIGKKKIGVYWIIALIGALSLILTRRISLPALFAGLSARSAVNPIKILVLFLSMTALSVFLDEIGFFRYLAGAAIKVAGDRQTVLFYTLYGLVSILTVFTSNDVIILTFTPFICYFTRCAGIDPLPYLVSEFVAANTWSMALIIGNPTNIYLGGSAGITFGEYLSVMALPTLFAGLISLVVLRLLFRRQLAEPMDPIWTEEEKPDRVLLTIGLSHLLLCTALLAVGSYVGFEMWAVSLGFAVSLFLFVSVVYLIRRKPPRVIARTARRLPWPLVPFVLSMFTLVLSLSAYGVTQKIGAFLGDRAVILSYGGLSCLAANLVNNIPMSVLFSSVLSDGALTGTNLTAGIYSTVIGSNLGAFLTPLGALAGIMWASMLNRAGVSFSFKKFTLYGVILVIPSLAAALLGLYLRLAV
ncbi:MAG: hypothetical protein J5958_03500 [Clostridia bacterium]|nr:hypothetical protein [Clostridia bacterium]